MSETLPWYPNYDSEKGAMAIALGNFDFTAIIHRKAEKDAVLLSATAKYRHFIDSLKCDIEENMSKWSDAKIGKHEYKVRVHGVFNDHIEYDLIHLREIPE